MCLNDRYDMTVAVKVVLNPNTINQSSSCNGSVLLANEQLQFIYSVVKELRIYPTSYQVHAYMKPACDVCNTCTIVRRGTMKPPSQLVRQKE